MIFHHHLSSSSSSSSASAPPSLSFFMLFPSAVIYPCSLAEWHQEESIGSGNPQGLKQSPLLGTKTFSIIMKVRVGMLTPGMMTRSMS